MKNRLAVYAALAAVALIVAVAGRQWIGGGGDSGSGLKMEVVGGPAKPAAIGGPFTLIDHNGRTVTDADFRGKWMLIFFGYTFCPDVCPTNLTTVAQALEMLGPDAEKIVPVFVSVDPQRDTPAKLKEFVALFHPRLIGMTGTQEQIMDVARKYRVYYAKVPQAGGSPDDYLMDHGAITYLMGPDGNFRTHFSHGAPADQMAARLKEVMAGP